MSPQCAVIVAALRDVQVDRQAVDRRVWLDPIAMTRLFSAYGIPITPAAFARDAEEAVAAASPHLAAGNSVVLKIFRLISCTNPKSAAYG